MRQASPWWFIYTWPTTVAVAASQSAINAFKMWLLLLCVCVCVFVSSTWADIIVMIHDPNYILLFVLLFVSLLLFASNSITRNCSIVSDLWLSSAAAFFADVIRIQSFASVGNVSIAFNSFYLYVIVNIKNSLDPVAFCHIDRNFNLFNSVGGAPKKRTPNHVKIKDKWDVSL